MTDKNGLRMRCMKSPDRPRSPTSDHGAVLILVLIVVSSKTVLFLQHTGVRGVHGDHVAEVVAVELNIDPGPVMELDCAPGHQVSRVAVTMAHAVRWVSCLTALFLLVIPVEGSSYTSWLEINPTSVYYKLVFFDGATVTLGTKGFSVVVKTSRVKLSNNCEWSWNLHFVAKSLPLNVTPCAWKSCKKWPR